MPIKIKTPDGQEGELDVVTALQGEFPDYKVKNLDVKTGKAILEGKDSNAEIDVGSFLKDNGLEIMDVSEVNSPDTAVDTSPLAMKDRAKLGLLSREAPELARLAGAIGQLGTAKELDAKAEKDQQRALGELKKSFQDARIINGEYVVKKDGVWHKADAPGLDMGDVAQFAGANGLNILGAIAGGRFGGPAGSVGGSVLAEAGEELVATAVAGGTLDPKAAAYDIVTDGILGLVGNASGQAIGAGASGVKNLVARGMSTKTGMAVQEVVERNIDGFRKLANMADSGVKDIVAKIYGNLGPDVSQPVMREVIESADNVAIAKNVAKAASSETGKANVLETITNNVQAALNKVKTVNQDKFGKVVGSIINKADDRIELDLDATAKELEAIIKNASPENRGFLNPVLNTVRETADKIRPKKPSAPLVNASGEVISDGAPKAVLKGKEAALMMQQLKGKAGERLNKLGVNRKTRLDNLTDMETLNAAFDMEDLLDSKLMAAADTLELGDALKVARAQYGATKDYMRTFWTKSFSETNDVDNIVKVLQGKMSDATETAITKLDELHPEAGIKKAISKSRAMYGGIEMQPIFAAPKSQVATGLVGGTVASAAFGNPQALLFALPAVSPRASYLLARGFTGANRGVSAAAGMTKQAAEVTGKQLVRMASSAGFLNSLGRVEAYRLLKSPGEFEALVNKMNQLIETAPLDTEANVTEAAIKRAEQPPQKGEK